ncbi:MAG: 2-oxoacid:acceptor oxidoreductase family protein [Roseburia sp.]|nr:2-oxoacid:acceptor oxidoreductase family protein [Roseburia sp.]MCM1096718.1 2-oxoacid:acceptor oxidoreductase family protein [Ruminococcus flavefaciens]
MQKERITQTMDGNTAAAHIAYFFSEAAAVYPITPSSPMAELCGQWAAEGRKNLYGSSMKLVQMQSEAGAAATVHGAALSGALATTFTSSQGLLLMLPNLYRIAGELLPCVIHVAARTLATHALSIFGDHSDIYACRQTGAAIFACGSVQEIMDLAPAVHLASLKGSLPFLSFFDGFRTSHELRKIQVWSDDDLRSLFEPEALDAFRRRSLHPSHGRVYGSAQNPDIFFQNREASNPFYLCLPEIVGQEIGRINDRLGTRYGLFDYYGAPNAEHVIVAMGSVCETIREYLDYARDKKYGLLAVHLYRPFSVKHFLEKLPGSIRRLTVLDRTREPGAPGEPLYLDVVSALQQGGWLQPHPAGQDGAQNPPRPDGSPLPAVEVFSGRYGLSSRDTTPAQIAAVYENRDRQFFTLGIVDDVTLLSLPEKPLPETAPPDVISCKFWGLGGDGTISATKNALKIIGAHTDLNTQGYFEYDSKKSRGLTISHLRFGKSAIRSAYLIRRADLAACHNPVYLHKYKMAQELKDNGIFLLNSPDRGGDARDYLPEETLDYMSAHRIRFFVIDALKIGKETGLNGKISTILQAAFFAVSGLLPKDRAIGLMKEAARKSYGKNGENIIRMNEEAIDRGFSEVRELPVSPSRKNPSRDTTCSLPDRANSQPNESPATPPQSSSSDSRNLPQDNKAPLRASLDNAPLPDRPEILDYVRRIE